MPTSYTSLLGLALPVTGELSGTWGDTVNDYITKYVDASVAGTQTISGSQTAVTLTRATGASLSQVGSGLTGSSQYQIINCTGNPAGTLTVTVDVSTGSPTLSNSTYSQTFAVINGTSTSQSVVVRATTTSGTSTGVTLVSGEKALIAWNGSDFIKVATSTVDGVSTFSAGTTGFTPSTATSGAVTLAGTLATTNGGTGLTSFTANRVFYSSSTSAIGSSANLTFDGTTLTANALTTTSTVTINGGTANGVAYLNGSKVLTTGSALTFDGTNFQAGSNSSAGTLGAIGGSTGATISIVPSTSSGANGVTYNTSFVTGGAGPHIWQIGGNEQARLTTTGLGIGTSSPATKLEVSGSSAVARITGTSASVPQLQLSSGGVVNWSLRSNNDGASDFTIYQDSTQRLKITSAGDVGIGTSSPSAKLHVVGNQFRQNDATNSQGYTINTTSATTTLVTLFGGSSFAIQTGGSGTNQLLLDSSGNLGIGTSSPSYKLDVNGLIRSAGDAANFLLLEKSANTGVYARWKRPNREYYLALDINNNGGNDFSLYDATAGATRWTVDSSGNLGLGVTPSAWGTVGSARSIQVVLAALSSRGAGSTDSTLTHGAYYNGTNWIYQDTSVGAARYQMTGANGGSTHSWSVSAGGTAGNAISFTQAMTLDASGNLLAGLTSPLYGTTNRVQISANGSATAIISVSHGGLASQSGYMFWDGTNFQLANNSTSGALIFGTNAGTERARITSTGGFNLGGTADPGAANLAVGNGGATNAQRVSVGNNNGATIVGISTGGVSQVGTLTNNNPLTFGWFASSTYAFTEFARITDVGNFSIGGTATRGTTAGTAALQLFNGTAPAGTLTNGVSLYSQSGDLRFMDAAGNASLVGYRGIPQSGSAKTGSYTLATTDVGDFIQISTGGSIVIPNSTFAAGDVVSLFNNTSGSITITCSTTNAYIAGTDTNKASMTLATRGVATILFVTSTLCVVSGNVT